MLMRIEKLASMTFDEIRASHRHQYGAEKIPVSRFTPSLPDPFPDEVVPTELLVYRRNSNNNVFAAHRIGSTLHVLFIEARFGDLYTH